jgi:predicted SprT family Zn-dependent metalloprotease
MQILRDLFNLKDQIKKNEFSIMKTPDQPKKNLMILVVKGKDKKTAENSSNKVKKTKYFFLCFCQSSGEYELNSYTVQKRYTPSPARGVQN